MNVRRVLSIAILTLGLSGCASNVIESFIAETDYDDLYLRGVFSWWEADEKYKLVEISNKVYTTRIELIADGQPYDFKFADANWTPGKNCGYEKPQNQIIKVGETVKADCETTDQNFRFTPKETGEFEFVIDFSGFGMPKVTIYDVSN